jgi:bacillithiol biosynthesis deacetylase BshB1
MGYKVGVVDLTEGEFGTRGTPKVRAQEREGASRTMGLAVREGLGLPDMGLVRTEEGQIKAVVEAIRRLRPSLVLAPHWEDRHPDHVEGSVLVTSAFFFSGVARFAPGSDPFRPSGLIYYQGSLEFDPSFIVDISAGFEKKMEAIASYASQFSPRSPNEPETEIAHPHFLERVRARGRHYGLMAGVEYGEPYFTKRPVVVSDPISLIVPKLGGGNAGA